MRFLIWPQYETLLKYLLLNIGCPGSALRCEERRGYYQNQRGFAVIGAHLNTKVGNSNILLKSDRIMVITIMV